MTFDQETLDEAVEQASDRIAFVILDALSKAGHTVSGDAASHYFDKNGRAWRKLAEVVGDYADHEAAHLV